MQVHILVSVLVCTLYFLARNLLYCDIGNKCLFCVFFPAVLRRRLFHRVWVYKHNQIKKKNADPTCAAVQLPYPALLRRDVVHNSAGDTRSSLCETSFSIRNDAVIYAGISSPVSVVAYYYRDRHTTKVEAWLGLTYYYIDIAYYSRCSTWVTFP